MKRILILLLSLVMCLGCFAACNPQGGGEDTTVEDTTAAPEGDEAATLAEALEYLRSIYKDSAKETPADYDVVGKIVIGDTEFKVTWTTDNADIVVKVSEKNAAFYTIDIPVKNEELKDYALTATVTDAAGQSETISFERALPVYDSSAIVDKPEEQQAYKLYLVHAGLGQTLFATGETDNSKFLKTTTDPKAAMDFYSEADGEGFKFYYLKDDGTKMYLLASTTTSEDGKVSKYLNYVSDQSTTWIYKSETNGWYTTIDGIEYVMGTYGSYNTMSLSEASYLSVENSGKTQFPAGIMKKDVAESMTPSEGPTIYNTPEEIVNAVYALDIGGILSGGHKYTLTGVITSIPSAWSDDYGNITVVIVVNGMEDKPIECFRLKGDGANKLAVGDTITVTGELLKYDNKSETGKVEFNAGCTLVGGATAPETTVTNPTADGVYKLYLVQVNTGKTLFANGETDNDKFLKATTDPKAALDFRAEIVEGGFKFYTEIGGVKKYLNAHTENVDGKISKFLHYTETSETVWYYKAETNAWYTTIDGAEYVAGTYNSFDTFSISDTKFMTPEVSGKTQFPLSLVEKSVAEGGNMGGNDEPETPDTPDVPVDGLDAQAPVAGTAYKFGFIQGNQNKVYYLTGVLSGYYMASTETFADGADFFVEETNGGFHLYCMVNGAKKYVNAKSVVGTDGKDHINGLFEDTATSVYTYDETLKTLVTKIDGTDYIYGTRNDKTYNTLGPMKADSGCFYAVLVVKAGSAVTPDTPDEPDTPDVPSDAETTVIYFPKDGKYVTGIEYEYTSSKGTKKMQLTLTTNKAEALPFTVIRNDDGTIAFMAEGKYLMADGTNVELVATAGENTLFVLEEADGGQYIRCATANYQGKAQYLEVYSGYLTCYGMGSDPSIYVFELQDGTGANGKVQEFGETTTPDTPSTPSTPSGEGVSEVKVDTPYYLFGTCGSGTTYFSGSVNNGRIDGSTTKSSGVVVKLEAGANAGEYYIYFMDGNTKTYIAGVENKSAGLNLVTTKDDTCVWVIDNAAKTIINKAISNRGLATQVASQYTNFSFYATSNFGTAEYQTSWFMAA